MLMHCFRFLVDNFSQKIDITLPLVCISYKSMCAFVLHMTSENIMQKIGVVYACIWLGFAL